MNKILFCLLLLSNLCFSQNADPQKAVNKRKENAKLGKNINEVITKLSLPVAIKDSTEVLMNLEGRMKYYHVTAVSISIINKGKIEWSKAFGFRDVNTRIPLVLSDLFQVASLSKPVTALAALKLIDQGILSLDEDVNKKLRGWIIPDNKFTSNEKVTLRRILSHTAGFTIGPVSVYTSKDSIPTTLQSLTGTRPASNKPFEVGFIPGSRWKYSGIGYTILQQLMTDVTGQSFSTLMNTLVLSPLKMRSSYFLQPLTTPYLTRAVTGHDSKGQAIPGNWPVIPEMAAGGLWSTSADMSLFMIAAMNAWKGKSGSLISQKLAKEMFKVQKADWGLGFTVIDSLYFSISHTGNNPGYRCIMVGYPELGKGAVILTNGDGGDELRYELLRSISKFYNWPEYKTKTYQVLPFNIVELKNLEGIYDYGRGFKTVISIKNNRLYTKLNDGPEVEIFLRDDETYFSLYDTLYEFIYNDKKEITGLFANLNGSKLKGKNYNAYHNKKNYTMQRTPLKKLSIMPKISTVASSCIWQDQPDKMNLEISNLIKKIKQLK